MDCSEYRFSNTCVVVKGAEVYLLKNVLLFFFASALICSEVDFLVEGVHVRVRDMRFFVESLHSGA